MKLCYKKYKIPCPAWALSEMKSYERNLSPFGLTDIADRAIKLCL